MKIQELIFKGLNRKIKTVENFFRTQENKVNNILLDQEELALPIKTIQRYNCHLDPHSLQEL